MLCFNVFHCFCLVQVLLSVVAVLGPNTGRKFRCCANPVNQQCGYFAMSLFYDNFCCGLLTLDISWLFDCGDFLFLDSWPSHMGGTTRHEAWLDDPKPAKPQEFGLWHNVRRFDLHDSQMFDSPDVWSSSSPRHFGRRFYHGPETPLNKALKGWSVFYWPFDLACFFPFFFRITWRAAWCRMCR